MSNPTGLRALGASPARAVVEAAIGYAVLLVFGAAFNGFRTQPGSPLSGALVALGWLWLCTWPAWRVRPVRAAHWWGMIARGVGRGFLIALSLALIAITFTMSAGVAVHFWPVAGFRVTRLPAVVLGVAIGFGLIRTVVIAAASAIGHARLHLRWQLMGSHVAVIILTFAALTALGSVAAIGIALHAVQPNSVEMARSVRAQLTLTGRAMDPSQAQRIFLAIERGQLPQRGQPPLLFLVGSTAVPQGIALLAPDGAVVSAVEAGKGVLPATRWWALPGITRDVWASLRSTALQGRPGLRRVHFPGTAPQVSTDLAAVSIQNAQGRAVGILLLAAGGPNVTATQFFQGALVLFGATTIILVGIASVPLLAVSFLFSYFVARGLTRRLEAVSWVATQVAAGNFAERAPDGSRDEVGRLAEDVNLMAGRLERLVAELTRARTQAEEALETRRELVANVSHELRTPLAVLYAHLESIAAGRDGTTDSGEIAVRADTVETLRGETLRLAAMIDDLFALSRAETGTLPVERQPVDVGTVVDEVMRLMRPLVQRESAIVLTADVPSGLPPVAADPGRLHQILANLVRNAIRHTPEGGIVALSGYREGGQVCVTVSDTGEGIAPEDLPHVFKRFYRADPSRARETGGAGLGLAIVRELVELMGGSVRVESTWEEGSHFTVSLPVYSPADRGASQARRAEHARAAPASGAAALDE